MIKAIINASIWFYRKAISPLLPKACRFYPTCSVYTAQAIEKHGVVKGMVLGGWRILRCHPWHDCDYDDPVPEAFSFKRLIHKQ